jgi:16S rRNA (guanine1207-N2)-methyltransferase
VAPDRLDRGAGVGEQYFSARPTSGRARRTIRLRLPDLTLELASDRGVFAADRVDAGTLTLLRRGEQAVPDGDVADVGCGYGPIALTLARRNPAATVWAVDVNERARALCAENAARHGIGNVRVVAPEEVPDDLRLAAWWSNPPVHVGKAVLHALLVDWLERLTPAAAAHLVVHKHLGSDSLARWLTATGSWTSPGRRPATADGLPPGREAPAPHTRAGSTSMRNPRGGRGMAANASASVSASGARTR